MRTQAANPAQAPCAAPGRGLTVGIVVLVVAAACQSGPTPIKDILANPAAFDRKAVTVSGEVTDSANVLVLKYYRVDDGSGRITVVTKKAVPLRGAKVRATGTVHQAFVIGDESLTVLLEDGE
jgi:hypothetical protein